MPECWLHPFQGTSQNHYIVRIQHILPEQTCVHVDARSPSVLSEYFLGLTEQRSYSTAYTSVDFILFLVHGLDLLYVQLRRLDIAAEDEICFERPAVGADLLCGVRFAFVIIQII